MTIMRSANSLAVTPHGSHQVRHRVHRTRRSGRRRVAGTMRGHETRTRTAGPRQRWQLLFSRTEPALRMRQAELVSELERAFTEASLPLSYTGAQKPRPRIKLAANLPVGIELRGEVVEAYFDELVPLERIQAAAEQFPEGIELRDAKEVWHGFPSAASQLRGAEYEVEIAGDDSLTSDALRGAVVRLLNAKKLAGKRRRGESERRSDAGDRDLRPLIEDVEVVEVDEKAHTAHRCAPSSSWTPTAPAGRRTSSRARPAAEGRRAVRTRLLFVDTPPIASVDFDLPRAEHSARFGVRRWTAPVRAMMIQTQESTMYAVVTTGGKQYRVEAGTELTVERLAAEPARRSRSTASCSSATARPSRSAPRRWTAPASAAPSSVRSSARSSMIFKFKQKVKYRRTTGIAST